MVGLEPLPSSVEKKLSVAAKFLDVFASEKEDGPTLFLILQVIRGPGSSCVYSHAWQIVKCLWIYGVSGKAAAVAVGGGNHSCQHGTDR